MKTIFKERMKVYDQLNFPNKKGVIVEISNDENDPYPVEVSFENEAGRYYYTPEGRFNKKHIPTLSTKPYEVVLEGFEQKEPEITYEKIILSNQKQRVYMPTIELKLPNDNMAEAFKALAKLIWLRDYYNEGWQPDWDINKVKYIIKRHGNRHFSNIETSENHPSVLYFKSREIRDKFLEEQRELLEIAKPLL